MTLLSIDFETRSAADLKKRGAYRYFEDPTADVLCAAYAFDDGPVETWVRGQPCPEAVQDHVQAGGAVAAWNASFELWGWMLVLGPRHGWPVPRIDQMRDTMAQAAAMSIPQALAGAAQALGLEQQKDKDGQRLIRKFSIPRKARKGDLSRPCDACDGTGRLSLTDERSHQCLECGGRGWVYYVLNGHLWNEPEDHPQDFAAFVRYSAQDVEVERAVRKKLVPLSDAEQAVWELTATMNTRGVLFDRPLIDAMLRITDTAKARLDAEMARVTGYAVTACSQVSALTGWLKMQGVDADKLNKNAIEELLDGDLPENARHAVQLRKEAAKTSTAKLDTMLATMSSDDRVRGLHLYHGAGTGRWSGRLVQTQNLPRGTGTVKNPEAAVDDFLTGEADWISMIYGRPMSAVSDMLRATIRASDGCRLLAADYSSIEGRVTAWVAGEQWKLDAFVLNDTLVLDQFGNPIPDPKDPKEWLREGPGMYELAAAGIFNCAANDIGKKDPRRQVGKASELALGFGGGVMAYDAMARVYNVDMAPVFPILRETAEPETFERAEARYAECLERGDTGTDRMSREAWIASEITKVQWRARHPSTVDLWSGLENAARSAVEQPGTIHTYGKISYRVAKGFLWCLLPSRRCLAYGAPMIEQRDTPWGDKKPSVTALGVDSITKRWTRFALYGGLLTENCLSGSSEVLTDSGWQRMDTVDTSTRVWDGQEFVAHAGLIAQGQKETIRFGGLWLTPDHKVLTLDGWKHARDAEPEEAAPPRTELAWRQIWPADGHRLRGLERSQEPVVDAVRLWDVSDSRRDGAYEGPDSELRVPASREPIREGEDARDVKAPGLRSVAVLGGQMSSADSPRLGQLRRAGYLGMRALELVRELLGRHGRVVSARSDDRQGGQFRKLRARQLPLGAAQDQLTEQADERNDSYAARADAPVPSCRGERHWRDDLGVSGESRVAGGAHVRPAGLLQSRIEPVYDLLNCGPRHRFVARGGPGERPFIVHNCVQAIARDLMAHGMLQAERAGYPITMTVHDEAVADVPVAHGTLAEFERLLCSLPEWATGLPVVASGYESFRYKKD